MKLSKKSTALQRAIQRTLASGKALGGLLVGLVATVAGCRENSPAHTMGRFPDPRYRGNDANENRNQDATPGELSAPQPAKTNAANEYKKGMAYRTTGIPVSARTKPR